MALASTVNYVFILFIYIFVLLLNILMETIYIYIYIYIYIHTFFSKNIKTFFFIYIHPLIMDNWISNVAFKFCCGQWWALESKVRNECQLEGLERLVSNL